MARLARLCVPDWPHLVVQHGHSRQPVFRDDIDRRLFLDLLREAAAAYGVSVHAYGLLDNEVRLLVTPSGPDGLSLMMQTIGRRYGARFNRRHRQTGSLWEGRFGSTIVEPERHLLTSLRFVEDLRSAGDAAAAAGQAAWSSARHHLGMYTDPMISDHLVYWSLGNTPFERQAAYAAMREQALTDDQLMSIADAARKGWPLGSQSFIATLSTLTDRRLLQRPKGRPTKTKDG